MHARMQMARTLSEFHYTTLFIDGAAFANTERLHDELAFKLGLPSSYVGDFDALFDCLSSIGDTQRNLCSHWESRTGKRLVLQIRDFAPDEVDADLLLAFTDTVAEANTALDDTGATNRIWIEYMAAEDTNS